MKRIFVPVDFSAHTEISCQYALMISNVTGAEIILFHSFFDQFYYSDGGLSTGFESGLMMNDEIIMDLFNQKKNRLDRIAKDLNIWILKNGKAGITVNCRIDCGDPEVQIIQAAMQINPDLIVMGSGGMGKKGLLAGSVARRIIDHTDIPVIAVPDLQKISSIQNIAYMTTFDKADVSVIQQIESSLSPFRVNIFCLHLSKNAPDPVAQEKMNNLSNHMALINHERRISCHLLEIDHEKDVLQNFMAEHRIDLIAFIPHKRNMFKNLFYQGITREDLFHTHIPVMAVRPAR